MKKTFEKCTICKDDLVEVNTMEVVLTTLTDEEEELVNNHYAFRGEKYCKKCQDKLTSMVNDAMLSIEAKLKKIGR